jgi:hypothetical protein
MSRRWRRHLDVQERDEGDREAISDRIAAAVLEDEHGRIGHQEPRQGCPRCAHNRPGHAGLAESEKKSTSGVDTPISF